MSATATIAIIVGLILAAMVMFLLELLTTSFGIMTGLGVAALGAAIWFGFTLSNVLGIMLLVASLIGVPLYFLLLLRLLPRFSFSKALFLSRQGDTKADGTPEAGRNLALVGQSGVAETELRPSGAVRVGGLRLVGLAESGVIDKGAAVVVVGLSGSDLVVRPAAKNGA